MISYNPPFTAVMQPDECPPVTSPEKMQSGAKLTKKGKCKLKKATAIVMFEDSDNGFHVKSAEIHVPRSTKTAPIITDEMYPSLRDAYHAVLAAACVNGFHISYCEKTGTLWYDVVWCDMRRGYTNKFFYAE